MPIEARVRRAVSLWPSWADLVPVSALVVLAILGGYDVARAQGRGAFTLKRIVLLREAGQGVLSILETVRENGCFDTTEPLTANQQPPFIGLTSAEQQDLRRGLFANACTVAVVEIPAPADELIAGNAVKFSAIALTADRIPLTRAVIWSADDARRVTFPRPENGLAQLSGVGRVRLTATVGTIQKSIVIDVLSAVKFSTRGPIDMQVGTTYTVDFLRKPPGQVLKWQAEGNVTVNDSGVITAKDPGTTRVVASLERNLGADTVDVRVSAPVVTAPPPPPPARPTQSEAPPEVQPKCPSARLELEEVIRRMNDVGKSKKGPDGYRDWPKWRTELRERTKGRHKVKFEVSGSDNDVLSVEEIEMSSKTKKLGKWKIGWTCDVSGNNIFDLKEVP